MAPSTSHKKLFRGVPFSHKTQADRSNQLWGIDMTYIWCGEDGWAYMHAVIDHHDKELLGYHFSRSCSSLGGVMALAEAALYGRKKSYFELNLSKAWLSTNRNVSPFCL